MFIRPPKIVTLLLLLLAYSGAYAESKVYPVIELGLNRTSFDDLVVTGKSTNPEWAIAISYNSVVEFGYKSIIDFSNASMDTDAGIESDDGFFAFGNMYYLRGSLPLSNDVDIFALVGRSKFTVESTSTYGCLFFCGDFLTTTTESDYLHEETGTAIGFGLAISTIENRQVTIQYVDYNYRGEFYFKAFTFGYRWLFYPRI